MKIRADINEIKTKKTIQRINGSKSWFFERFNKLDRPLAQLTRRKKEQFQINRIQDAKGNIMTENEKIQTNIQEYFKNLYYTKFENLREMDEYLQLCNSSKLNTEDMDSLIRPMTYEEIQMVFQKRPTKRIPGPDGFMAEFYETFKKHIQPLILKLTSRGKSPKFVP